jgi:hypothetical protein
MGRSIWILDHLTAIRDWSNEIAAKPAHLFRAADAIAWQRDRRVRDRFTGEGAPAGAAIHYYLKEPAKNSLRVEIVDAQGKVVRRLSKDPAPIYGFMDDTKRAAESAKKAALPNEKGLNGAVWDLRHSGAVLIEGAKIDMGNPLEGPFVLPGVYKVRLEVDGAVQETTVTVAADPRERISDEERRQQVTELLGMRDDIGRITGIVETLRSIRKQIHARAELLKGEAKAADLLSKSAELVKKLDSIEDSLHNPKAEVVYDILAFEGGTKLYSRMVWVYAQLNEGAGAPVQGVREVFAAQRKEFGQVESDWKRTLDADLGSLNIAARELDVPAIYVPKRTAGD